LEAGAQVRDWVTPAPGGVAVSVKDTGIGITSEIQARLFQRFHQMADDNGNRPPGTGLGLVICREIVRHYNGAIWVTSKPGKGSTFTFALPLKPEVGDAEIVIPAPDTRD
jgi:signal transduction histidine kinase